MKGRGYDRIKDLLLIVVGGDSMLSSRLKEDKRGFPVVANGTPDWHRRTTTIESVLNTVLVVALI